MIAIKRFGLGPSEKDLKSARSDPQSFILDQLDNKSFLNIKTDLPSSVEAWQGLRRFQRARRAARQGKAQEQTQANAMVDVAKKRPRVYRKEVYTHFNHALNTQTPFVERLCWFWTNHFCVSSKKNGLVRNMAGGYAREAIRPFVLGNFRDLLHSVISHPAMLIYLDNHRSIGPNSKVGIRRNKGLNENLAREIFELHTLGVKGGYSQEDVVNLARALTGWGIAGFKSRRYEPGQFVFRRRAHEPGAVTILGKTYDQEGANQAKAVLDMLARHPSTAEHIAKKLAIHFMSDAPPPNLIRKLKNRFLDTNGDLKEVVKTLVLSDESWSTPHTKLLPPLDMMIAISRALSVKLPQRIVLRTLRTFGQPMWGVPSPAGWPDNANAWASPDALLERLDWASRITNLSGKHRQGNILEYAHTFLGNTISEATREALQSTKNRRQALNLLIMSTEMQRR